jgi:hypothetical protein
MNLQQRLASHFAAATAIAALATTTTAQVATTVINQVVPATTAGIYVNVETGVWNTAPAAVPGWDLNPWSSTSLSWFNPSAPTGGVYMRFPGSATTTPGSQLPGTLVDANGAWTSGASTFGAAAGNWTFNADNFFAFRFIASDNLLHYGWGRISVGATATVRTLREVHWEMTPDAPILIDAATSQSFGAGCAGLTLGADAAPRVSTSVTYTLSGIPNSSLISVFGLNFGVANPGTPFPLNPACSTFLNWNSAATILMFARPTDTYVFSVPSGYLGLPLLGQGATLDASLLGSAAFSNGIASVLGR